MEEESRAQDKTGRKGSLDPDRAVNSPDTQAAAAPAPDDRPDRDVVPQVPVVAVGASAGGLEAFKELLEAVPSDSGVCWALVQHLDPDHKSMLTELLARATDMPVALAEDGQAARPGHVVVIPPDATLTLRNGIFRVKRPAPPRSHRTPIDTFFNSLAEDQSDGAVAIILSGTGSDGTEGLRAIKAAGGFAIVQSPESAKYDSMPRSAMTAGLVDKVLEPAAIPACVAECLAHLRESDPIDAPDDDRRELRDALARISSLLKRATGHEFRDYKEPTLVRRVQRRMQVLRIAELADYVDRLRDDRQEAKLLFRELLVSVTGFFRDPEAFDALKTHVIDPLVDARDEGESIRVWVPGCATGEEAYSIAMLLHDRMEEKGKSLRLQVFATDLDDAALEIARRGVYSAEDVSQVHEHFVERYFREHDDTLKVCEEIRELCIFSTQSLIKDPPFSRLDLISCRNVLIYFKTELQNRLIPVFHYALSPGGSLFLGTSENVSRHSDRFAPLEKKWRVFRRLTTEDRPRVHFPMTGMPAGVAEGGASVPARRRAEDPRDIVVQRAERALLDEIGPAYAVIDRKRQVIYSGGQIETYISFPRGAPSFEIVTIAREGLRMELRALVHRATTEETSVTRDDIGFDTGSGRRRLSLECRPLDYDGDGAPFHVIAFHDRGPFAAETGPLHASDDGADQIVALEHELQTTREYLQSTTEELESSNEELKSANEELMSMNEELQSSNEELETSKEELQSVNEELETVNTELSSKVEELGRLNGDLQNLLESTQIATLFLDRDMRLRRFTPVAKQIFHFIDSDNGRSITDITSRVRDVDLGAEVRKVFDHLTPFEKEVTLREGDRTFTMTILPYRTLDGVIDGVVVTFVDVTRMQNAQAQIDQLNDRLKRQVEDLETILDLAPVGIAFVDDPEFQGIEVNRHGARIMELPHQAPAADDPDAGYRFMQDGSEVAAADLPLQKAWRTAKPVAGFRATYHPPSGNAFDYLMSAAPVFDEEGKVRRVIGVYDDVSALTRAQSAAEARAAQQEFIATLGSLGLRGMSAEDVIARIPAEIATILDVDFAKVLRHRPEDGDFELMAEVGFDASPGTVVGGGMNSQAGYTLESATPVIVTNLATERRFSGPALLSEAGVVSGASVIIGDPDVPWGVLGTHTKTPRQFSADDVQFLQAIANVIAATLQRDAWGRQQRLLLDELRHRVKNSLATVQAIASMSLRKGNDEAGRSFFARLQALAAAHDLQFSAKGEDIDFADLVARQTQPYEGREEQLIIKGRMRASLPTSLAIDLSIVIHELLTNAVKHGALANHEGRVEIDWRIVRAGRERVLVFDWREFGGPAEDAGPPSVGSSVIGAISAQPGFRMDRRYEADGLACTLEVKLRSDTEAE